MRVENPILRGFHPDPSIIRVGDDYYIATSTFEWWPGVQVSHSRDLVHWDDQGHILTDPETLDLRGLEASMGIWAPDLSYFDGTFYLVYTVVRSYFVNMYDTENYVVTASSIDGPWSKPVKLDGFGFDPSLFHDDDGRKYLINPVTDHRTPKKYKGRLLMEEVDLETGMRIGEAREIYASHEIFLEGPHIIKKDGWYYLFAADTGTGPLHGESVLRSKEVFGPYEMFKAPWMVRNSEGEAWSILTSRHDFSHPIQRAGHGDLVETPSGEWYMVHLCSRPCDRSNGPDVGPVHGHGRGPGGRRNPLGRETAIERIVWRDGWPMLDKEGVEPALELDIPGEGPGKDWSEPFVDDFDGPVLGKSWLTLRTPLTEENHSFTARPGHLRLYGRGGLGNRFNQSLIARRIDSLSFEAETLVDSDPKLFKCMAGLIVMYDTDNYFYLHVTRDEEAGKCVTLLRSENRSYSNPAGYVAIDWDGPVRLKVVADNFHLSFLYGKEDGEMKLLAGPFDGSFMSDEACVEGRYTGSVCGVCAQDLSGNGDHADFDFFRYSPKS